MNRLNNKVALITGGSSGIGLATAMQFVAEGAYVYIFGRRQSELDKAIAGLGPNAAAIQGDVSKLEDLDQLYATIAAQNHKLDILFVNAAIIEPATLGQITEAMVDRLFAINAKGVIFTVQKALPLLRDGASIILTGSVGANKGIPGQSVYTASKATVRTLARTWMLELKNRKIRVNVVTPGGFDTPGATALLPNEAAVQQRNTQLAAVVPLGRIGNPPELANVVTFLASDEASYVNGADFQVDGGIGQY